MANKNLNHSKIGSTRLSLSNKKNKSKREISKENNNVVHVLDSDDFNKNHNKKQLLGKPLSNKFMLFLIKNKIFEKG
ncbi:MAG: hypothetical protein ABIG37_01165 [Nanoarchaeota archaeon]|nr:hypothetical protein [Nanoarchaeota archaeon]